MGEERLLGREEELRAWFTRGSDPLERIVDGLDIGWGGVQLWATGRTPALEGRHLDVACGYATFLAQLGWRFPSARLVGLNIDFEGPHALARPLLTEAGVAAVLVEGDARRLPFASGSLEWTSCFLGLQDSEIQSRQQGVEQAVVEAVRVLGDEGALVLLDEFPFERFDRLLRGLPITVVDRAERALEVRWRREVAERAVELYAHGWAEQTGVEDEHAWKGAYGEAHRRMAKQMERQLAEKGAYVPFGPVRLVVGRKREVRGGG